MRQPGKQRRGKWSTVITINAIWSARHALLSRRQLQSANESYERLIIVANDSATNAAIANASIINDAVIINDELVIAIVIIRNAKITYDDAST